MLNQTQKEAAEMYALKMIGWKDVLWLCGHMDKSTNEEVIAYADEYGKKYDLYVLSCVLKTREGLARLFEHTATLMEEYDLYMEDLSVEEVINSLILKIKTGYLTY